MRTKSVDSCANQPYTMTKFNTVLVLSEHPSPQSIPPNTIVMNSDGSRLYAYWLHAGSMCFKWYPNDEILEIINGLPAKGECTNDIGLINAITSKYECDLTHLINSLSKYITLNADESKCHER